MNANHLFLTGLMGLSAMACDVVEPNGEAGQIEILSPVNIGAEKASAAIRRCFELDDRGFRSRSDFFRLEKFVDCANRVLDGCNMERIHDVEDFCTGATHHGGTTFASVIAAGGSGLCALPGERVWMCRGHLVDEGSWARGELMTAPADNCEPYVASQGYELMGHMIARVCPTFF